MHQKLVVKVLAVLGWDSPTSFIEEIRDMTLLTPVIGQLSLKLASDWSK